MLVLSRYLGILLRAHFLQPLLLQLDGLPQCLYLILQLDILLHVLIHLGIVLLVLGLILKAAQSLPVEFGLLLINLTLFIGILQFEIGDIVSIAPGSFLGALRPFLDLLIESEGDGLKLFFECLVLLADESVFVCEKGGCVFGGVAGQADVVHGDVQRLGLLLAVLGFIHIYYYHPDYHHQLGKAGAEREGQE